MLEYFSIEQYESKICPGVVVELKKLSKGRRSSFNLRIAEKLARKSDLQRQLLPVSEEITRAEEAAKSEPCTCAHMLNPDLVTDKLAEIKRQFGPSVSIEIVDQCHSSITRRCMVEGCNCREPKPDEAIGGYEKYRTIMDKLVSLETDEIGVERLKFFVAKVQGLKIDGRDLLTGEDLIEYAPEALTDEVSGEISRLLTMTAEEALGFKPPITGGAAVVGRASTVTVP